MTEPRPSITLAVGPSSAIFAVTETSRALNEALEADVILEGGPRLAGPNEYIRIILDHVSLHDVALLLIFGLGEMYKGASGRLGELALDGIVKFSKRRFLRGSLQTKAGSNANIAMSSLEKLAEAAKTQQQAGQYLISIGGGALEVPALENLSAPDAAKKVAEAFLAAAMLAEEIASRNLSISPQKPDGDLYLHEEGSPVVKIYENGDAEVWTSSGYNNNEGGMTVVYALLRYEASSGEFVLTHPDEVRPA